MNEKRNPTKKIKLLRILCPSINSWIILETTFVITSVILNIAFSDTLYVFHAFTNFLISQKTLMVTTSEVLFF